MEAIRCSFKDRPQAGKELARHLLEYAESPDVVVLALARGGVPVAFQVARSLRLPLEVLVVGSGGDRARAYRSGRQPVGLAGKQVILVADGLANRSIMRDAMARLKAQRPWRTIVAVPFATPKLCRLLKTMADTVVCPVKLRQSRRSATCYEDTAEVTDDAVQDIMKSRV
jgi:putative phosphoribosyl transferase